MDGGYWGWNGSGPSAFAARSILDDKAAIREALHGAGLGDYVARLTKLAFVSPAFADAIAEGNVPLATNRQMLLDGRVALPLLWNDQEPLFAD